MKLAITLCAITLPIFAASCSARDENGKVAAESAATAWLALIDAGKYDESWTAASTRIRQAVPQEEWRVKVGRARAELGRLRSRKLQSATLEGTIPEAPDGEYVVIKFASSFERKMATIETVTPRKDEHGVWRVSGYYIK
jgi:Protein of unknown function (DUF4019)